MIRLDTNNKVQINCPSPQKYPRFCDAFQGKRGKASDVKHHEELAHVSLDVPPNQPSVMITVEKSWLSHI